MTLWTRTAGAAAQDAGDIAGAGGAGPEGRISRSSSSGSHARALSTGADRRGGGRTGQQCPRSKLEARKQKHTIQAVVDRLVIDDKIRVRLADDSVETGAAAGARAKSSFCTSLPGRQRTRPRITGPRNIYSNRNFSPATGESYDVLTPKHFSFNSPAGACATCHGLGRKLVFRRRL